MLAPVKGESQGVNIESYSAISIRNMHYSTLSYIIQFLVQYRVRLSTQPGAN